MYYFSGVNRSAGSDRSDVIWITVVPCTNMFGISRINYSQRSLFQSLAHYQQQYGSQDEQSSPCCIFIRLSEGTSLVVKMILVVSSMDMNTINSVKNRKNNHIIGPRGPNRNSAASLGWGRRCLTPIYGRIQINSDQKFYRAQRRNYYVWDLVRKSLRGTRRSLCRTYQL